MIDGHGDDIWRYGGAVKSNFSTNVHAAFDHRPLMAVLASAVESVTGYPEPVPASVEQAVARMHGCNQCEVMVTNGATEAIYMIAMAYSGGRSAIVSPTFSEYGDACRLHGHEVTLISNLSDIPDGCSLVWLCNPNNPTGRVVAKDVLVEAIADHSDKVFVVDQAYSDYTQCPTLTAADAVRLGNVVMLGSLTKRFAVPGLRIGYAIGCSDMMSGLRRWRMPWSVNGPAIKGALYLLDNIADYAIDAAGLHSEALRMASELERMGVKVLPTDCNFILCELPDRTAGELKEHLMARAGLLIRDASNFDGLGVRHFRVAAQTPEENDQLINEIRLWLRI